MVKKDYTTSKWGKNAALHHAIVFATQAHQGQSRKGTDIPYISHPFEVAQILTAAGCDTELIIAGLLHDVLEDTDETPETIEKEFGPVVLSLIQSNSEDKSRSWEERKRHTIDYMTHKASLEELLLACADKLSNLRSIKADYMACGDELWAPLEQYDMYWEISNLYTDVFVNYYRGYDEAGQAIYQTNGRETYFYSEDTCRWVPLSLYEWEQIQPDVIAISKSEAIDMEVRLREDFPSPLCLVRHQRDADMIALYAKKLLRQGYGPGLFADLWNNMGGGIPADTLRAVESAFLALYKHSDQ